MLTTTAAVLLGTFIAVGCGYFILSRIRNRPARLGIAWLVGLALGIGLEASTLVGAVVGFQDTPILAQQLKLSLPNCALVLATTGILVLVVAFVSRRWPSLERPDVQVCVVASVTTLVTLVLHPLIALSY